jgi:hypothetical protein
MSTEDIKIYCVKCKKKQTITGLIDQAVEWNKPNGSKGMRHGWSGTCSVCGCRVKQFKKNPATSASISEEPADKVAPPGIMVAKK